MADRVSVSAADFVRNIGLWQEQALKTPVSITRHGKERLVLLSAERYAASNTVAPPIDPLAQAALLALRHLKEGFIAYNDDLFVTDLNAVAEAYFGIAREDLIGRRLTDLFPPIAGSMAIDQIKRVAATRASASFETESVIFSGVRLAITAFPLLNGMAVLFSNITEREAMRSAAMRGNALLAGVDQHPGVSVVQLDARGRFVRLDAKFSTWSGFEPGALLNCRLIDLLAPADRRRVGDAFDETALARKVGSAQAALVGKDLKERQLSLAFSPVEDCDGRLEVWTMVTLGVQKAAGRSAAPPQ